MAETYIDLSITPQGVANLSLNRPEVHNAFDDTMIEQIIDALQQLADDPSVRVLVLKANGKNFSAGADLNWMRSMAEKDYQQNLDDAGRLAELMRLLDVFPKPTIAVVQGAAFGGAVGLVACCDIAIADPKASFCLSEVKIGLIPAVISPYVMRAIGERASRRYFITAERFFADEAHRLGLVHQIAESDSLDDSAQQMIKQLLQNSPAAVSAAKALIANVSQQAIAEPVITKTTEAIAQIRVSAEGQEGLTAFLTKRSPNWLPKD
ncbi:enoyl-CoA hydratase/isomerase family protein [Alkalimonas collagenimarina]|uniref:Enoyl-CoA hydratase/isomerase family protein n=1 Tax=Alkalimonas collagenimarina TaxID=400390 RepID=A0ABT9GZF8_9GAMM|nr:enoyl-CoA hydratase/isomerase family protein [Alkalimonas collagenimarina]MDP4536444.1 enoyl-CoA hydratase/isomerase family protein [Alkalimonas collagenimarina]